MKYCLEPMSEENTSSDLECGEVCLHVIFLGQNAKHTLGFTFCYFSLLNLSFFISVL